MTPEEVIRLAVDNRWPFPPHKKGEPRPILSPLSTKGGGPLLAAIAARVAPQIEDPWRSDKDIAITFEQMHLLEKELGRSFCASADAFFGNVLCMVIFPDEDLGRYSDEKILMIDCRDVEVEPHA